MKTKYRMLRKGERIHRGDEFRCFGKWYRIELYETVGKKFNPKIYRPIRRKVKTTPGGAEGR